MAIIKNRNNNDIVKDVEKEDPSYTAGGNVSYCNHYGKQY
jgi:hypothetical protein